MIHHWKALDMKITDFEYYYDLSLPSEIIQLKKLKLVRAEQKYKREADWKEAGEERSDG